MELNLFKTAFGISRDNSDEIFNGFGFKDKSDVTKYYLHPDNQSKSAQTSLSQPIAEGVVMFVEFLKSYYDQKPQGELFYKKSDSDFIIKFSVNEEWHNEGVFDPAIAYYRARIKKHDITLCAYDSDDNAIPSVPDNISEHEYFDTITNKTEDELLLEHYKICAAFVALAAKDFISDNDIQADIYELLNNYGEENFVILCEDFYQRHKYANYKLTYADIKSLKTNTYVCFALDADLQKDAPEIEIAKFPSYEFSDEQLALIPALGAEFRLDSQLVSVCNAVTSGDIKSLLLHGPAGTGILYRPINLLFQLN